MKEIDRKILYELDLDCRTPDKQIAEKLGTYPSVVRKKIQRMERDEIIRGYSLIINTRRIGYITYNTFIQFGKISAQREKQLREYLQKDPHVSFMVSLIGNYDLMVTVKARSLGVLEDFLQSFQEQYGQYIHNFDICSHLVTYFLPKKYLLTKVPSQVPVVASPDVDEPLHLSETDQRILQELKKDSRRSSVDIGHKLQLNHRTVIDHINKLQERQIIIKFLPLIRIRPIGYTWYLCVIKLRKKSKLSMKKFFSFLVAHPNLVFMAEGRGKWDLMLDIHCKGQEELADILREVRNHLDDFGEIIPMIVRDRLKHEFVMPLDKVPKN